MTSTPPRSLRLIAFVLGACLLAAATPALAQQKGAPKAATPPNAGIRQQGQDVQLGGQAIQPGQPNPNDAITTDPRQHMRNLISDISAYGRSANSGFAVITFDGLDLLERVDPIDPTKRAAATTYIKSIDGVIVHELNFHAPNERGEIKNDDRVHAEMMRLADIGQKRGLRMWSIDYAKDAAMAQESIRFALKQSYVPFPSPDPEYRFARIPPGRPVNENPHAITGLNHVKNFLMVTDTSRWDTQEEFVLDVANTNYDAVVIDVFHRGRTPMTARTVEALKYKKLGSKRMVFAYVNIGQAESYRYYWKPGWREGSPAFITAPHPGNPDKYTVQYWDPAWRDLIVGNTSSYIYGVVAQGFDGVVLDGVEAFRVFEGEQ